MTFTKNTPRDFVPEGFTECGTKDFSFDRAAVSPSIRLQVAKFKGPLRVDLSSIRLQVAKFKGPLGVDLVYRGVPPKAIEDEVESAAAADEGVYDVKLTDSLASKDDETQPPAKDDSDETQLDSARVSPAAGPAAKKRRRAAAEDHPSFTFSGVPCCSQDSQKSAMSDDPAWW